MYDFSNQNLFDWAIKYVTDLCGGEFPKDSRKLKKLGETDEVSKYLLFSIRKNGNSKYKTWSEFQEDYFANSHTKHKRFKEKMSYEEYRSIRNLLSDGNLKQVEIIKKTGCSYGTISRIVKKHQRFDEYYTRYEKDGISLC